jgi:hypothetical protein
VDFAAEQGEKRRGRAAGVLEPSFVVDTVCGGIHGVPELVVQVQSRQGALEALLKAFVIMACLCVEPLKMAAHLWERV